MAISIYPSEMQICFSSVYTIDVFENNESNYRIRSFVPYSWRNLAETIALDRQFRTKSPVKRATRSMNEPILLSLSFSFSRRDKHEKHCVGVASCAPSRATSRLTLLLMRPPIAFKPSPNDDRMRAFMRPHVPSSYLRVHLAMHLGYTKRLASTISSSILDGNNINHLQRIIIYKEK